MRNRMVIKLVLLVCYINIQTAAYAQYNVVIEPCTGCASPDSLSYGAPVTATASHAILFTILLMISAPFGLT